jgi:hypothetical protein
MEQRCCLLQVGRVEALGEPAIDRRENVARFLVAALVVAEPGEARGGAQLPELRLLLRGDAQGFAIQFLGGLGMPLPQQQLAFVSVQLSRQPARPPFFSTVCKTSSSRVTASSICPATSYALAKTAVS